MAVLIRPKSWGSPKPPPGTRIDTGHPLARGLLFGFGLSNAGSDRSLASLPVTLNGATGVRSNQSGCLSCATVPAQAVTAPLTVMWHGRVINWLGHLFGAASHNTTGVTLFSTRNASGNASPTLCIGQSGTNPTGPTFAYDTSGTGTGANIHVVVPLDKEITVIGTVDAAANYSVHYSGMTATNNWTLAGSRGVAFTGSNWYTGWSPSWDGTYYANPSGPATDLLLGWSRVLSGAEISQLTVQPYAMFTQPAPALRYWLPAAATPPTVNGDFFLLFP